jgi:hypothetical protein
MEGAEFSPGMSLITNLLDEMEPGAEWRSSTFGSSSQQPSWYVIPFTMEFLGRKTWRPGLLSSC